MSVTEARATDTQLESADDTDIVILRENCEGDHGLAVNGIMA